MNKGMASHLQQVQGEEFGYKWIKPTGWNFNKQQYCIKDLYSKSRGEKCQLI